MTLAVKSIEEGGGGTCGYKGWERLTSGPLKTCSTTACLMSGCQEEVEDSNAFCTSCFARYATTELSMPSRPAPSAVCVRCEKAPVYSSKFNCCGMACALAPQCALPGCKRRTWNGQAGPTNYCGNNCRKIARETAASG